MLVLLHYRSINYIDILLNCAMMFILSFERFINLIVFELKKDSDSFEVCTSAGEGIRTPEPTEGQSPKPCAFDRSATPAGLHYKATLK